MPRKSQFEKGVDLYVDDLKERLHNRLREDGKSIYYYLTLSTDDRARYVFGYNSDKTRLYDVIWDCAERTSVGAFFLVSSDEILERLCPKSGRTAKAHDKAIDLQAQALVWAFHYLDRSILADILPKGEYKLDSFPIARYTGKYFESTNGRVLCFAKTPDDIKMLISQNAFKTEGTIWEDVK